MRSSAEEANDILSKWRQESRRIAFVSTGPPIEFSAVGILEDVDGLIVTFANPSCGLFIALDLDAATFEYLEPGNSGLPFLPAGRTVSALSVAIDGSRRLLPAGFGIARFMLIELAE